jgi:hypothetical protein
VIVKRLYQNLIPHYTDNSDIDISMNNYIPYCPISHSKKTEEESCQTNELVSKIDHRWDTINKLIESHNNISKLISDIIKN